MDEIGRWTWPVRLSPRPCSVPCAPGEPTGGVHAADSVLEGELESRLPCLYKADA